MLEHFVREDGSVFDMADRFKKTFSREVVRVHFMGLW